MKNLLYLFTLLLSLQLNAQDNSKRDFKKIIAPQIEAGEDMTVDLLKYVNQYPNNQDALALLHEVFPKYLESRYQRFLEKAQQSIRDFGLSQTYLDIQTQGLRELAEARELYLGQEPPKELPRRYYWPVEWNGSEERDISFFWGLLELYTTQKAQQRTFMSQLNVASGEYYNNQKEITNPELKMVVDKGRMEIPQEFINLMREYKEITFEGLQGAFGHDFISQQRNLIRGRSVAYADSIARPQRDFEGFVPQLKSPFYASAPFHPTTEEFIVLFIPEVKDYWDASKATHNLPLSDYSKMWLRLVQNIKWEENTIHRDLIGEIETQMGHSLNQASHTVNWEIDKLNTNKDRRIPTYYSLEELMKGLEGDNYAVELEYEVLNSQDPIEFNRVKSIEIQVYKDGKMTRKRLFSNPYMIISDGIMGTEVMYTYEDYKGNQELYKEEARGLTYSTQRGFQYDYGWTRYYRRDSEGKLLSMSYNSLINPDKDYKKKYGYGWNDELYTILYEHSSFSVEDEDTKSQKNGNYSTPIDKFYLDVCVARGQDDAMLSWKRFDYQEYKSKAYEPEMMDFLESYYANTYTEYDDSSRLTLSSFYKMGEDYSMSNSTRTQFEYDDSCTAVNGWKYKRYTDDPEETEWDIYCREYLSFKAGDKSIPTEFLTYKNYSEPYSFTDDFTGETKTISESHDGITRTQIIYLNKLP